MGKPKLRHLALFARDPAKLAQFYVDVFDMEIVPESEGTTARHVTDGYFTLAILPHRLEGSAAHGLNHFGFAVEDLDDVRGRMAGYGVETPKLRPADRPYAEYRAVDPEGNWFDLSEHGYDVYETGAERSERGTLVG